MITMVSHGEVGCVGINFDPAAITDPEAFIRCMIDGFTEVLTLHLHSGSTTPAAART
jgi:hypothetical protein